MKKNQMINMSYILENITKGKVNLTVSSKQIILYGSVGTNKSKVAKLIANSLVNGEMSFHIDNMCSKIQII